MQNPRKRGHAARSMGTHSRLDQRYLFITEGRGSFRGEIGMACVSTDTAQIILSQFTDTSTYSNTLTKIDITSPYQIIVPSNADAQGDRSRLHDLIHKNHPHIDLILIQRKFFDDKMGLYNIKSLVAPSYAAIVHQVVKKHYLLAAAAAAIKYIESTLGIYYSRNCVKIVFHGPEDTMMIDSATVEHLELIRNSIAGYSQVSLFGVLDVCRTLSGKKLLRMSILQPPCKQEIMDFRLDCVTAIINNVPNFFELGGALSKFSFDLDQIISTLIVIPQTSDEKFFETRINSLISLNHTLTNIPTLAQTIKNFNSPIFTVVYNDLCNKTLETLELKIQAVVNFEVRVMKGALQMQEQRIFAVKPYINDLLDASRSAYVKLKEDINLYWSNMKEQLKLNVKMAYTKTRGHYFQIPLIDKSIVIPKLPQNCIRVTKMKNSLNFTTRELLVMDHRLNELIEEISLYTENIINDLIRKIRQDVSALYVISEHIESLDYLYCLAHFAMAHQTVRPTFSQNVTAISRGVHPYMTTHSLFVQNDIVQTSDTNCIILTGPNMSGKTTVLKQYAVLQILAQLGSYVPANAAEFRIADSIYSRIGNGDCIEEGSSSFQVEMSEMSHIISNAGPNSLIIIDELGRGTSMKEANLLCFPIVEALVERKAFVVFATHLQELTFMEKVHFSWINYTMETFVEMNVDRLSFHFTRIMKRGRPKVERYGMKLAGECDIKGENIEMANEISQNLTRGKKEVKGPIKGQVGYAMTILAMNTDIRRAPDEAVSNYVVSLKKNTSQWSK